MTIEEWAKDFKSFVNELEMPRDDYKGIMEYIDDAIAILKQEAIESINFGNRTDIMANLEGLTFDDWRMYHSDTEVQNIAQSAFDLLIALLKEQETMRCKNCRINHQCAIQAKFADAEDEENWFCKYFTPSSGREVKWE
jgi:hypothetical protein